MTATKEYVNKTNEYLQQEAALNALNTKAFKDIERPFFIKPLEEKRDEINLERNIAETNLKQITTNDDIAKAIVQTLVDKNELSTFNRYFTVFQKSLKDQKIQSLGQFNDIFNNFKTNIISDVSKTGLLPAEELIQNVQNITKTLDIPTAIPSDLNVLSEEEIDRIFRNAVKIDTKNEVYNDQVIDGVKSDGSPMQLKILDTRGYVDIKPATSKKPYNKKDTMNAKIRYIIKVYRPTFKYAKKQINWKGSALDTFKVDDFTAMTPVETTSTFTEPAEGSGLRLYNKRIFGRGGAQKKS